MLNTPLFYEFLRKHAINYDCKMTSIMWHISISEMLKSEKSIHSKINKNEHWTNYSLGRFSSSLLAPWFFLWYNQQEFSYQWGKLTGFYFINFTQFHRILNLKGILGDNLDCTSSHYSWTIWHPGRCRDLPQITYQSRDENKQKI